MHRHTHHSSPCAPCGGAGYERAGLRPQRWQSSITIRAECRKGGAKIDLAGYDAGKKIKGKKRQTAVDTIGLLINIVVTPRRRAGSPHHRAAFGNSAPTLSITQEGHRDGGTRGKLTAERQECPFCNQLVPSSVSEGGVDRGAMSDCSDGAPRPTLLASDGQGSTV
jgi:hypothetical protein